MKKIIFVALILLQINHAKAQFTNLDFETWATNPGTTDQYYPVGWHDDSSNYFYQITPAQNGNYAMCVSVWYYYVKSRAIQEATINYRPTTLQGYYKYTENTVRSFANVTVTDNAEVSITLTKWNNVSMQRDTIGSGMISLNESINYSHFSCPITYTSDAIPDSAIIILDPSIVRRDEDVTNWQATTINGKCSFLTVDNVSLTPSALGIPEINSNAAFEIFPNPTSDILNVSFQNAGPYEVVILDVAGRKVMAVNTTQTNLRLPVSALPSGIYFVKVTDKANGFDVVRKFVRE